MFRKRLVVEVFHEEKQLVGHADLHEVDDIDADSPTDWPPVFDDVTNEDASDSEEPGLLFSLVLLGTVVAAEYIKSRREDNRSERNRSSGASEAGSRAATAEMATLSSIGSAQSRVRVLPAPAAAAPAGWHVDASDATRLRYWDGTAWTAHFAPRSRTAPAPAPPAPAGWHVDASDATRLRYWDGTAWTAHFAPRSRTAPAPAAAAPTSHAPAPPPPAVPAGWYPDPEGLGQRWWDGVMWGTSALIPSAMDILNVTFTRTQFRHGYNEQDVDECLDLIAANLALPLAQRTLRPEEVMAVNFRATQFGVGYDEAEVDRVLDQLAVDLGLP